MTHPGESKDLVIRVLRERIASHELKPGTHLSEKQLCDEFGLSRAVVREIFTKLEQRGLIQRNPNKGAVVIRLELTQVFEIYMVREMLEGLCARLAAQNVPPESWQDLVELFGEPMEQHVRRGELEDYIKNIQILRSRIIAAANSPMLTEMLDLINDKVSEIARRIIVLPGRAELGLRQQRGIVAALRRGDAAESERLRRENIASSAEYLRRYQRFVL